MPRYVQHCHVCLGDDGGIYLHRTATLYPQPTSSTDILIQGDILYLRDTDVLFAAPADYLNPESWVKCQLGWWGCDKGVKDSEISDETVVSWVSLRSSASL